MKLLRSRLHEKYRDEREAELSNSAVNASTSTLEVKSALMCYTPTNASRIYARISKLEMLTAYWTGHWIHSLKPI